MEEKANNSEVSDVYLGAENIEDKPVDPILGSTQEDLDRLRSCLLTSTRLDKLSLIEASPFGDILESLRKIDADDAVELLSRALSNMRDIEPFPAELYKRILGILFTQLPFHANEIGITAGDSMRTFQLDIPDRAMKAALRNLLESQNQDDDTLLIPLIHYIGDSSELKRALVKQLGFIKLQEMIAYSLVNSIRGLEEKGIDIDECAKQDCKQLHGVYETMPCIGHFQIDDRTEGILDLLPESVKFLITKENLRPPSEEGSNSGGGGYQAAARRFRRKARDI